MTSTSAVRVPIKTNLKESFFQAEESVPSNEMQIPTIAPMTTNSYQPFSAKRSSAYINDNVQEVALREIYKFLFSSNPFVPTSGFNSIVNLQTLLRTDLALETQLYSDALSLEVFSSLLAPFGQKRRGEYLIVLENSRCTGSYFLITGCDNDRVEVLEINAFKAEQKILKERFFNHRVAAQNSTTNLLVISKKN